jgi:ABC-type branched-subunit amino acid transport system permease subunit
MKDREDRVRFSGYDVANFKVFVFCLAAAMSGVGGALLSCRSDSSRHRSSASCHRLRW